MSQPATWGVPQEGPVSPSVYANRDQDSLDALLTRNSGDDPPAYAVKGAEWLDTSETPHPVCIYDGAVWVQYATLDPTGHELIFDAPTIAIADVTGLQAALDAKVPDSRTVSASGLATGGGSLGANRTITVTAASQAQAEAGTDNATAMTPLRTAQAIAVQATPAAIGAVPTSQTMSESQAGIVEAADDTEAIAGSSRVKAVTPGSLAAVLASLGSGLELIGQTTTNGLSNVDFTGLGGYSIIVAHLAIVSHNSGSNQSLLVRTSADGGGTFASGSSSYRDALSNTGNAMLISATGVAQGTILSGIIIFVGLANSSMRTICSPIGFQTSGAGLAQAPTYFRDAEEVNDALRFLWSGGSFDQGKIALYGLAL